MDKYAVLICIDGMAAYYLRDERCKMPNLRKLMERGAAADKMTCAYPTSTWPMNTSIITGTYPRKHGVLGNWVVERASGKVKEHFGDRCWDKEEVVQVPTLYDLVHQQGGKTAAICWPVTRGATTIDFNIPEFYEQELFETYSTPDFWKELKEQGLPVDQYGPWSKDHARGPMQDWLTTEAAKYLIRRHKPNLMLLHYLVADSFQHDYGTLSPEAFWALDYIDERIGELIASLEEEGLYDKTDLFVVSDHGFVDTHSVVSPNVLFKQKGWYDAQNPEKSRAIAVSNGGVGYVYVLDEEHRQELKEKIKQELLDTEGVEAIFENGDYPALGLPTLEEHPNQADLIFEAAEGYFVYFGDEGEDVISTHKYRAMHGYLPSKEKLKGVFVASGPHVHNQGMFESMNMVDIAPTIASTLGIEMVDMDGQVLRHVVNKEEVKA